MAIVPTSAAVDVAIAAAKSKSDLVERLATIDPMLASQLQTKLLWQSKTPWGVLLVAVLSWATAHYGLQLDPETTQIVAGVGVLVGSYIMRLATHQPVSLLPASPTPPA